MSNNTINIKLKSVCNMSRVPINIEKNILTTISRDIVAKKENLALERLREYYRNLKYTSLNSLYGTGIEKLDSFKYYNYFLPWVHNKPVIKYRDDAFITSISESQLREKINKIKNLINSILYEGYNPENYIDRKMGHVTGYFLRNESTEKFYVVSGNHRVAVLHSLGYEKIPAIFEKFKFMKPRDKENCGFLNEKHYPTEFNIEKVRSWASVKSGFLTAKEAEEIFQKYIFV